MPHLSSQAIVFLVDIDPSSILPDAELLFFAQLFHLPIMPFVSYRRRWSEDKGPRYHREDERKAEEEERIAIQIPSVETSECTLIGAGSEPLGLECWHSKLNAGICGD